MPSARFLFFLYTYPPDSGTAAKRNARIADYLISKADEAHIFTSVKGIVQSNASASTTITTTPSLDYRAVLRRQTKDGAVPENKKKGPIMQFLVRLINTFPFNILFGEGGLVYFINLLIKGNKCIRNHQITHLYSSYRPFADHYAAYWLKKWNPDIYWIADFRDLIIDPHYNHLYFRKTHQHFFKKLFRRANLLTTVSDGLAAHLRAYNSNVIALRNGISGTIEIPAPTASTHFNICYSGSMFLDKRNAEPIFQAIQELIQDSSIEGRDIRIIYAGKDGKPWNQLAKKYRFESLLEDKGIITEKEVKQMQQDACINVLLTISSDALEGVLTGKMIEYFEAGAPVMGIVVQQNDPELQSILSELEIGDSFSDRPVDVDKIKAFVLQEYTHWKQTGKNRRPVNLQILQQRYAMDAVMQPLIERIYQK